MKIRLTVVVGFILVLTWMSGAWAQDSAALRGKIEALYEAMDQALEAKDLATFMSLFTDDYQVILAGTDRQGFQDAIKQNFQGNDQLRTEHTIIDIAQSGDTIKVAWDQKIEGKSSDKDWGELYKRSMISLLIQEGNILKFARSAELDKNRLSNVNGQTYKDGQMGFSFAAPENWMIIPSVHPTIQGMVIVLAPDRSSVAMLGCIKMAGIGARQGIEGDEMLTEKLSKEGTYKLFKSGPISIGGHEGFETESKFFLPTTQERYRRRIYFNAGGSLYILCFDAIPFTQWDQVKGGFQSMLDSIKVPD
jgi:ketosteroid isomerase-like protein